MCVSDNSTNISTRLVASLQFICLLAGCAHKRIDTRVDDPAIVSGVSTVLEVYQLLGQPHDVITAATNRDVVWLYYDAANRIHPIDAVPVIGIVFGGVDSRFRILELGFDLDSGILRNKSIEEDRRLISHWADEKQMSKGTLVGARVKAEMSRLGLDFDEELAQELGYWAVMLDPVSPN